MPKPTLKRKSSNEVVEEILQHNQDFLACRNCAPTPELPPNFDDDLEDALDWGSNEEMKYTFSSFSTFDTNTSTVLVPSFVNKGECNNMLSVKEVSKLYNVNFGVLDVLKCEHHIAYTKCAECRQKVSTMWLLDSGASAHFTNNKNDFIKYTPASESDRQPVRTTAHTIWIEGQGTVLLRHYLNGNLATTRFHPVLYIPAMTM